jgi:phosphoribosylanthranilate isomerase
MSETRVKICGITNLADAELATALGAWALGMIFFQGSPRRCSLEEARRIAAALRRKVELGGVFVNAQLEDVIARSEELGLTLVQLHGEEGPSFCAEVARRSGAKVIKATRVAGVGDVRDVERFHVDFHLLDTRVPSSLRSPPSLPSPSSGAHRGGEGGRKGHERYGGTGETFDWGLLAARHSKVPLILSGGLHPGNVAAAVAAAHPFAVDTASGTERAPGRKDPQKLEAFFAALAPTPAGSPA